jgi:hypothetical protein
MILTAHQPVYLPWLGLFHKIALSDKFVLFDEVQYLPRDWMNRNKIKTTMGEIFLTVPVLKKGHRDKKIHEIKINNNTNWKKKHFKSIEINYKKAPYFEKYISFFEDVYHNNWEYLSDLNEYMLKWFLKELGIKVDFLKAKNFNFVGTKSDLVLDMCKKLNSDIYIFGSQGKDYANINDFTNSDIIPLFQDYSHPKYTQLHNDFIFNLSILDLLFNCGPKSYEILMSENISKANVEFMIQK